MARYKKHKVRQFDTMQAVAQLETNDVNNWIRIADYNDLVYPYIVDTVEEKNKNIEHLVTVGDTIIIPIEEDLLDIDVYKLSRRDQDFILSLALGRDLNMTSKEDFYKLQGTSDELFELSADGAGGISTVQGIDNLKQAIRARLMTPKGSLLLHPEYGSNLHNLFGKGTTEQMKLIEIEICRTILTDGRISGVIPLGATIEQDTYRGSFQVEIESLKTAFEFVVNGDSNGAIVLL